MKLISLLIFVVAVVATAGVYLVVRKEDEKKSDLNKLTALPGKIAQTGRDLMNYLTKLFSSKAESKTAVEAAA